MSIRIGMPQMGNDLFGKYMKSKYVQSVKRAGGSVVWIDLEDPDAAASQILYGGSAAGKDYGHVCSFLVI